jgi:hypothetical protein
MNDFIDPEYDVNADWAFALAFAADQARYAFPVQPLQACKNVDCTNTTYAIFCSEDCRVTCEGDDTEDYYRDDQSNVTLGHIATADQQWQADQAAGGFAALVCGVQPQAVPAPVQPLPEAAASATVRLTIAGHSDVLFTVRDMDETRLLERLETLLERFPVQAQRQEKAAQSTAVETGEGWCPMHTTQMRWNPGKGGESGWWSHKVNGTWCKGKAVHHG